MVRPAFVHDTVARTLVHHLKYRGVVAAGAILAEAMASLVPPGTTIVPVPRVGWRRIRYGIDPGDELASAVAGLTGQPMVRALRAPLSGSARAGRAHGAAPAFRLAEPPPTGLVVLIDDVVTTGTTLEVAAALLPRVVGALTATGAGAGVPEVTSLPVESRRTAGR
ncbi:MAG: ComF family protein [Acidimicrobiia bacterium]